jgi:opacity protein-like surface antigen
MNRPPERNTIMRRLTSLTLILALVALALTGLADDAAAQRRGGRGTSSPMPTTMSEYKPGIDVSATYGWMWGGSLSAYNIPTPNNGLQSGYFRWASNPSYMFAIEVPARPGVELQLQYTLQPSQLNWDPNTGPTVKVADMSVNYWQIGATAGLPRGRIMPFTMITVGATYWSFSNFAETDYEVENQTKFSFTAGVGVKTFFGENQKVGIRLQFRVLPTFYDTFATIGTGGIGVSGSAVWQWDVGGGIAFKFGK